MPKFHKKFFKQTEGEDELILKCLSERGLGNIFSSVDEQLDPTNSVLPPHENEDIVKEVKVWKCDCPYGNSVYWKNRPKKCASASTRLSNVEWKTTNACKHFYEHKAPDPEDSDDILKPEGSYFKGKLIAKHDIKNASNLICEKEREVLCKAENDFIIGYADLFFNCGWLVNFNLRVKDGHIWEKFSQRSYDCDIVVEAKPKVKDTSAVLRQIKTYMDNLEERRVDLFGVIATYSDIKPDLINTLNSENVAVAIFENESKSKNNLEDFVNG